jgi:hypothetical protein
VFIMSSALYLQLGYSSFWLPLRYSLTFILYILRRSSFLWWKKLTKRAYPICLKLLPNFITPKGQSKMGNLENLATLGTQDEEKQKHNTICIGHHYAQTNTNNINKTCALLNANLLIYLVFLCCPIIYLHVPCCDVHYDFRIKTMFNSSLPPVVCRRAHVLFMLFVFVCA